MAQTTTLPLVGDLTPLQWGNWAGSEVMRPGSAAANPSINVSNFGADWRGANMDKRVVVALLDTAVYYEHPDLVNVIYRFSPEQQAALGCGEWVFNAVGEVSRTPSTPTLTSCRFPYPSRAMT